MSLDLLPQVVNIVLVALLFVVGVLLVWLHFRITALSKAPLKIQKMSDVVTGTVSEASRSMDEIVKKAEKFGPNLDKNISEAGKLSHELTYVIDRAEKILQQMDVKMKESDMRSAGYVKSESQRRDSGIAKLHSFEQASEQKHATSVLEEAKSLLGRINNAESKEQIRKASSFNGAKAYQSAVSAKNTTGSEAELELRRILEGRLS